jgi:YVTN family beta-propeller protein
MEEVYSKIRRQRNLFTVMGITFLTLFLLVNIASASPFAYISNYYDNTVSVVDLATNNVTDTISVGVNPFGVTVSPDESTVYVANDASDTVSAINTSTNTVNATIKVGIYPTATAISPDGSTVYVTNGYENSISVIDAKANKVNDTLYLEGLSFPWQLKLTLDGTRLYVPNVGGNTVTVMDTATKTVVDTVTVGRVPAGIEITPDGSEMYVVNEETSNVSVINLTTNTVSATIDVGEQPRDIAINPAGTKAYVAAFGSTGGNGSAYVIDMVNKTVLSTIEVGGEPEGVDITPDGSEVLVVNHASNTTSIINTSTDTVIATIGLGQYPYGFGNFIVSGNGSANEGDNNDSTVIEDYIPHYSKGAVLHINNDIDFDILVVWTRVGSKEAIFKVNIPSKQTRTVTTPSGTFDEYILMYPSHDWYTVGQVTLESNYEYRLTYYVSNSLNGTALIKIPDSEAPII